MKKMLCLFFVLMGALSPFFSLGALSFGVGSGFIFYGSEEVRNRNDSLSNQNQIILTADAAYSIPLAERVHIAFGCDTAFDFRWAGGKHIHLLDYAGTVGFQVYPGLAGLMLTVDYALGRRSDFYNLTGNDEHATSTKWGNGFKCGVQYDFRYQSDGICPIIGFAWRRMPRGNSADTILSAFLKLTIR